MEAAFQPAAPMSRALSRGDRADPAGVAQRTDRDPSFRSRSRTFAAATALLLAGVATLAGQSPVSSLEELRERARAILQQIHDRELSAEQARPLVERIRLDLVELGEARGWEPVPRRLELTVSDPEDIGPALADACPLFFEEELVQFCPVDPNRSEIWGDQVVVCEFACAPTGTERR